MPTLTIGDRSVSVGDDFLKLSPEQQNSTVEEISKSIGASAPSDKVDSRAATVSALRGIPVLGAYADNAAAAVNAVAQPLTETGLSHAPTIGQRYSENLPKIKAATEEREKSHPIESTVEKVLMGTAATAPLMMAAPVATGLTGTLGAMAGRGALFNAGLSGADAVARGENPAGPMIEGGLLGAGTPFAARGVGKLAQGIRDWKNPAPMVPQHTVEVAGEHVPVSSGRLLQDPAKQADEEMARAGSLGTEPQKIALTHDEMAKASTAKATDNIAAMMDPAGAGVAPKLAAEQVQAELAAMEADKVSQANAEGRTLSQGLGGGAGPVSAFDAAQNTGSAVTIARDAAKEATGAAYKARDAVGGEFSPEFTTGLAGDIRQRIASGDPAERIHVDPVNESVASKALKIIDGTVGKDSGLFADAAVPKPAAALPGAPAAASDGDTVAALRAKFGDTVADAYAKQAAAKAAPEAAAPSRPVDLKTMDDARKQLVTMYGDAKSAAIATGQKSDLRAMARILHEFDNAISDGLANGHFSGDAKLAAELQAAARKSHSEFKEKYSAKPGDEIGRAVEKILGRYTDTKATPEQIQALSYGPKSNPGTGDSVKVAGRLRKILGKDSPEYARWKQGLLDYVDNSDLPAARRAKRIDDFLNTSLAKDALTPADRAGFTSYSKSLRATAPDIHPNLARDIGRIVGSDGKPPATLDEVSKMIRANNGDTQRLMVHLKEYLTPESFAAVKREKFKTLFTAPDGHNEFTALQKAKNISDYLGNGVSKVVNTDAERAELAKLAKLYRMNVPLPNTTNPSGSATVGAKLLAKTGQNMMKMLGFAHGGVPGLIVGHAADVAKGAVKESRAVKDTTRLFFGPQAKRQIATSRIPQLLAPAIPASQR